MEAEWDRRRSEAAERARREAEEEAARSLKRREKEAREEREAGRREAEQRVRRCRDKFEAEAKEQASVYVHRNALCSVCFENFFCRFWLKTRVCKNLPVLADVAAAEKNPVRCFILRQQAFPFPNDPGFVASMTISNSERFFSYFSHPRIRRPRATLCAAASPPCGRSAPSWRRRPSSPGPRSRGRRWRQRS